MSSERTKEAVPQERTDRAVLQAAAEDASWLIARGYPEQAVAEFVGDHRALSPDQRQLLACSVRLEARVKHHIARELDPEDVARRPLRIDAASVLAVVAAALEGRLLLESSGGVLVDPSWERGATALPPADGLAAVVAALRSMRPKSTRWLVAERSPLSSWLSDALAQATKGWRAKAQVSSVPDVVAALRGAGLVASSDPAILDECATWLNLAAITARRTLELTPLRLQ